MNLCVLRRPHIFGSLLVLSSMFFHQSLFALKGCPFLIGCLKSTFIPYTGTQAHKHTTTHTHFKIENNNSISYTQFAEMSALAGPIFIRSERLLGTSPSSYPHFEHKLKWKQMRKTTHTHNLVRIVFFGLG